MFWLAEKIIIIHGLGKMVILKSLNEISILYETNYIVQQVLSLVSDIIEEGITTEEINRVAESEVKKLGAVPAFKGYHGYPASLCVSINEEIVHGIPSNRKIKNGDVVGIDFGAIYKEFYGDAAKSIIVGDVDKKTRALVNNTKLALKRGVEACVSGNTINDISRAISYVAIDNNYGNSKGLSGHGIGKQLHESPSIFNYINNNYPNIHLRPGLVIALEPMFSLGSSEIQKLEDNWTIITKDHSTSAHWEVSLAITEDGPKILGRSDVYDD